MQSTTSIRRWRTIALSVTVVLITTVLAATGANALAPGGTFTDDNGNIHEGAIEAIAAVDITEGCNPPAGDRYCPNRDVTREEMAAFLDRALDWPRTNRDYFTDDNASDHEASINRMAAVGATVGCGNGSTFCPTQTLSRGELAAMFVRAFDLTRNGGGDLFRDDNSSIFEADIDRLAAAGITAGCNPPANDRFCPNQRVTRDQAASFLSRALGLAPIFPPPANPTSQRQGVIWTGDAETGDFSQWKSLAISGKADAQIVTSPTHSGRYSIRLNNWDVDGNHNAGVRLNLQGPFGPNPENLPNDGYYSAWYYIPFAFEGHSNTFQFKQSKATRWDSNGKPISKTRVMLWKAGLYWSGDGTYDLEIRSRINQSTGEWQSQSQRLGIVDTNIPVGRWFHLEARYKWGQNGTGRTTLWVDGRQVWDRTGSTEANNLECLHNCREFVISHYLSDYQGYVAPGDSWIFIDDAKLATQRVGTK